MTYDLVVIGAGAGGCFASIRLAECMPGASVCVLESARKPLSKVEISGGGRCNVTHACFDPKELATYYPRGSRELLGSFHRFQPADMVQWLEDKGVRLKTESDGRMFPVSDSSQTIIDCFLNAMKKLKVELRTSTRANRWTQQKNGSWEIELYDGSILISRYLLIASGSDKRTWDNLRDTGHHIIPPVPSLFTFNIKDKKLNALLGVSKAEVVVSLPKFSFTTSGPLLITHWGLSGPAILKLSAWAARELYDANYVFDAVINWLGDDDDEAVTLYLKNGIATQGKKQVDNLPLTGFPARLWKYLCQRAGLPGQLTFGEMSKQYTASLHQVLFRDTYRVTGKSTFKEEFVTAGGVDLKDIDMRRFESKVTPGLFIVGEALNIDALTGGFNFQAAWTGGELAGQAIAEKISTSEW